MSEILNIAKRIIEFEEDDFITNPQITESSESLITDEDWQKFSHDALTFTDGNDIYQFAEEYPIVRYECNVDRMPDKRLNTFVKSITVSSVMHGKKFSVSTGRITEEKKDLKTVVYYEDNIGRRYAVPQYDIIKFLLKKPYLVVSSEGILIFFTKSDIIATIDCEHYAWIKGMSEIYDMHDIDFVEVHKDYCLICLAKGEDVHFYKLSFDIDMTDSGMIHPKVEDYHG